jgi:hypothetical protein
MNYPGFHYWREQRQETPWEPEPLPAPPPPPAEPETGRDIPSAPSRGSWEFELQGIPAAPLW